MNSKFIRYASQFEQFEDSYTNRVGKFKQFIQTKPFNEFVLYSENRVNSIKIVKNVVCKEIELKNAVLNCNQGKNAENSIIWLQTHRNMFLVR